MGIRHSSSGIRNSPAALAIGAHPDDIEFVMAGTLLLLQQAGWTIHYLNLSSGNLGSTARRPATTVRTRQREARAAAKVLAAVWHAPFCTDLEIFYDTKTLRKLCAIVREVIPRVILTHSPQDYMEDHTNTSRLTVTAAFARGMANYTSLPSRRPTASPVTIYHASPHGLRDPLRRRIVPGAFVDTTPVHDRKREALACHASQQQWLDASQGMNSYLKTMDEISGEVGRLSGRFAHAEGWRRHSHLGFCDETSDPLRDVLGDRYFIDARYEQQLDEGI